MCGVVRVCESLYENVTYREQSLRSVLHVKPFVTKSRNMSELVSNPSSSVYAAISVLGHRFEWEIGWVTIFGLLLTVIVGYGNLCFYVGQKLQEKRTPVKIQKAVPEDLWLAKATGQKYHIYDDCRHT